MKHFRLLCVVLIFGTFIAGCTAVDYSISDAFKDRTSKDLIASGQRALMKKNYLEAIRYFEALDALYPFGKEVEQAHLDIIYAYYKSENYASAIAAADRYIRLHPSDRYTPYAYYMRGITNLEGSRNWLQKLSLTDIAALDPSSLKTAFDDFSRLVKQFPESAYAQEAITHMIYIRNVLASREVAIADFYLKRKAYVAAINRASYVVKHIPGSSKYKEALEIMEKSYRALGMIVAADNMKHLLEMENKFNDDVVGIANNPQK